MPAGGRRSPGLGRIPPAARTWRDAPLPGQINDLPCDGEHTASTAPARAGCLGTWCRLRPPPSRAARPDMSCDGVSAIITDPDGPHAVGPFDEYAHRGVIRVFRVGDGPGGGVIRGCFAVAESLPSAPSAPGPGAMRTGPMPTAGPRSASTKMAGAGPREITELLERAGQPVAYLVHFGAHRRSHRGRRLPLHPSAGVGRHRRWR